MCGFVGLINKNIEKKVCTDILKNMNDKLSHRGPDDEGYFTNRNVAIAHKRLSIIDTSTSGRQPIFNEDKTISVVLNGEIYNYLDIRNLLTKNGHVFHTQSDTEVIVHAYEKWGIDFLNKLDGMFSLALYDIRNNRIVLARDPFGKKPLYYTMQNDMFLFASELKAFFSYPGFDKTIDMKSLNMYLAYEYVPAPYTIFKNCYKLPRASYIILDTQNPSPTPKPVSYWDIEYEPKINITEDKAIDTFRDLIRQSIKKRLMSDVPLGLFLSGGIDSSSILAFMRDLLPTENIKTFSIIFREKSYDESNHARLVAKHFSSQHHEALLEANTMVDVLDEVISNLDEPFADASIIPTFLLCKFAKKHVSVALGGDGGDELLAGYDPFIALKFAALTEKIPSSLMPYVKNMAKYVPISPSNMSIGFKFRHYLKGFVPYTRNNVELRNSLWLGSFDLDSQRSLLKPCHTTSLAYEDIYKATINHQNKKLASGKIDRLIDNYTNIYMHDCILVKVDRASMMNSLEVRSPFLDKNLASFVSHLPEKMKMKGFDRKYILKKSVADKLPSQIINRKKKGFGIPLSNWLRGNLEQTMRETFSNDNINNVGLFNSSYIDKLMSDHLTNKWDNRKELWTLLVFELWRKHNKLNSFNN